MKIQKVVTYGAVAIFLALLAVDISLPFRFPNDIIFWEDLIWPDLCLLILCALLIWGPKLSPARSAMVFLASAFVFVVLSFIGLLFPLFAMLFQFALFALYVALSQLKKSPSSSPE